MVSGGMARAMATAARARVEPVSWLTSRRRVSMVRPSPVSEMAWAAHSRRKSGRRRTSRAPIEGRAVVVTGQPPACRFGGGVGAGIGHRVHGQDDAIGGKTRSAACSPSSANSSNTATSRARTSAARSGDRRARPRARSSFDAVGVLGGADRAGAKAGLDVVAGTVEDRRQRVVHRRGVGGQQPPVKPDAALTDPVARLDDPRHDALAGHDDEVAFGQLVDVVVEGGSGSSRRSRPGA